MELKEGMYVRTDRGKIIKIEKLHKYDNDKVIVNINGYIVNALEFTKASNNIIDLIEVGDYVNGLKVYGITDYGLQVYMFGDCPETLKENEIETIVTKEQFESMSYKVGE